MKRTIRLTESDLTRIIKRIIKEEECIAPPQWLQDYTIDGKKGKTDCSNWSWRKDDMQFLYVFISMEGDHELNLSVAVADIPEEGGGVQKLTNIFGSEPKIKQNGKYYFFSAGFESLEEGGDLNQLLDNLQGKVAWMESLQERYLRNLMKKVIREMEDEKMYSSFGDDEFYDDEDNKIDKFDFDFDEEEFDDFDKYSDKYPKHSLKNFGKGESSRGIFNQYREKKGPMKIRKPRY
jgi:hypothetical protein